MNSRVSTPPQRQLPIEQLNQIDHIFLTVGVK